MDNIKYDLAIIGAGPAGYVAAIRASQLKLKVALIDDRSLKGGTCLNVGCIPSKVLLDISEHYYRAKNHFSNYGISFSNININVNEMMKRKKAIVDKLGLGIESLLKSYKIELFNGTAELHDENSINVITNNGVLTVNAKNILLSMGSIPNDLPFLKFDKNNILSSTDLLSLNENPESLIVIGSGAIGLELGSIWARLGTKVTVIEIMSQILPTADKQISKSLERSLIKLGITFKLEHKVVASEQRNEKVIVKTLDKSGNESTFEAEKILVAIGRSPNINKEEMQKLGIRLDEKGRVEVNEHYETSKNNFFACGDLISGPMLAHKAEEEGIKVAEYIALGKINKIRYNAIPNIVYTHPEVASVGLTEEQVKSLSLVYDTGIFYFLGNGRACAMDATDGFVKIISEKNTLRLLGVHIIGHSASELIHEAAIILQRNGTVDEIKHTIHAHPTLSEAIKEAALATEKIAIHLPSQTR